MEAAKMHSSMTLIDWQDLKAMIAERRARHAYEMSTPTLKLIKKGKMANPDLSVRGQIVKLTRGRAITFATGLNGVRVTYVRRVATDLKNDMGRAYACNYDSHDKTITVRRIK